MVRVFFLFVLSLRFSSAYSQILLRSYFNNIDSVHLFKFNNIKLNPDITHYLFTSRSVSDGQIPLFKELLSVDSIILLNNIVKSDYCEVLSKDSNLIYRGNFNADNMKLIIDSLNYLNFLNCLTIRLPNRIKSWSYKINKDHATFLDSEGDNIYFFQYSDFSKWKIYRPSNNEALILLKDVLMNDSAIKNVIDFYWYDNYKIPVKIVNYEEFNDTNLLMLLIDLPSVKDNDTVINMVVGGLLLSKNKIVNHFIIQTDYFGYSIDYFQDVIYDQSIFKFKVTKKPFSLENKFWAEFYVKENRLEMLDLMNFDMPRIHKERIELKGQLLMTFNHGCYGMNMISNEIYNHCTMQKSTLPNFSTI